MSNLGSSLGTAIAGTILVAGITATPERSYGLAMVVLAVIGLIGLVAAVFLPASASVSALEGAGGASAPTVFEVTKEER